MTRRQFLAAPLLLRPSPPATSLVTVPVLRLIDRHAAASAYAYRQFCSTVWDEAVLDFARCGVALRTVDRAGEIRRYPSGRPRILGLQRGWVNVLLADQVPLAWDNGRGLAGVSTVYEGFHLSVVAVRNAHPHRVPFVAVNTVVHELLHVLLEDILVSRAGTISDTLREARTDWYATRLWLFGDGAFVRRAASAYVSKANGGA